MSHLEDHYVSAVPDFQTGAGDARKTLLEMSAEEIELRIRLLFEEAMELADAMRARDEVGSAKELADVLYVAFGTGWRTSIPVGPVFAEVHKSNMTKLPPRVLRPDGKVLKDERYVPPRVDRVLRLWSGWYR